MVVFEIYRPLDELKMIENDLQQAEKIVGRSFSTPEAYKKVRSKSTASINIDIETDMKITVRQSIASQVIPHDISQRISNLRAASDSSVDVPRSVIEEEIQEVSPETEHPPEKPEQDHYQSNYLLNTVGQGNTPRESVAFAYSGELTNEEHKSGNKKPFVRRTLGSRDDIDPTEVDFLDEE